MQSIAVFCGSSRGTNPVYRDQAYQLGRILAERDIEVVFGGARVGLMGHLAEGTLSGSGKITGVIPDFLGEEEIAHDNLTRMIRVHSMHERKQRMHELSEGVIALPGGYGTMEEFFEMLTWAQLGLHKKPIALLNIEGFYDPINRLTDTMVREGFLKNINRNMLIIDHSIGHLLDQMDHYQPPQTDKWINQQQW